MVGAGALADLDALTPEPPQGHQYLLQGMPPEDLATILAMTHEPHLLQVLRPGEPWDVGSCSDLSAVLGMSHPGSVQSFLQQCRPQRRYRLIGSGNASRTEIVIPGAGRSPLADALLITDDPTSHVRDQGQAELMVWPGAGSGPVDRYLDMALRVDPQLQVTNLSADSYAPMVAPTRRLLLLGTALGVIASATLLVLWTVNQAHRHRRHAAQLAALGAGSTLASRSHSLAFTLAAAAGVGLGLTAGWLTASVYDLTGGLVPSPGALGSLILTVSLLGAAAACLVVWAQATRPDNVAVVEEMRRE